MHVIAALCSLSVFSEKGYYIPQLTPVLSVLLRRIQHARDEKNEHKRLPAFWITFPLQGQQEKQKESEKSVREVKKRVSNISLQTLEAYAPSIKQLPRLSSPNPADKRGSLLFRYCRTTFVSCLIDGQCLSWMCGKDVRFYTKATS